MSIITTNSIKDGRIREDGLEVILHQDSEIVMATRSVKWPGKANLMVSLISIINGKWSGTYLLDNRAAQRISSFLEEEGEQTAPDTLLANMNRGYKGSQLRGDGFILTKDEANMLIEIDERNSAVISIIVNGQEMTSDPMQDPERLVIDFKEMSYADASNYSLPFGRVQELVKPIRDALNPNMPSNRRVKEYWWQYEVSIRTLYDSIASHSLCFGAVVTSKYLAFSALPTDWVFTNSLYILTSDHWDHFAVVQCTLHEVWARKYSGSLKQDLRYSPSKCFDTFPFPAGQWETANATLAKLGERYHAHRKELMRHSWLGLTKVYNLFHDPLLREATEEELGMPLNAFGELFGKEIKALRKHLAEPGAPEEVEIWDFNRVVQGVLRLRQLHVELDNAVRDAYGWQDLDLEHDFHDVDTLPENDRTRYTISPSARKEVLKRLLALNHERHAEEVAAGKGTKSGGKKKAGTKGGKPKKPKEDGPAELPFA